MTIHTILTRIYRLFGYLTASIIMLTIPSFSSSAQFSVGGNVGILHTGASVEGSALEGTYYFTIDALGEYSFTRHFGVVSSLGWSTSLFTSPLSLQNASLFIGTVVKTSNINNTLDYRIAVGPSAKIRYGFYDGSAFSMMATLKFGAMMVPSIDYYIKKNLAIQLSIPIDINFYDALKGYYGQGIDHSTSITAGFSIGLKKSFGK